MIPDCFILFVYTCSQRSACLQAIKIKNDHSRASASCVLLALSCSRLRHRRRASPPQKNHHHPE
jgi:hypothetical protein